MTKPIVAFHANNSKLGKGVSTTYLPVGTVENGGTCPATCPFLGNGCYAQKGNVNMHQRSTAGCNPVDEADAIAKMEPKPGDMLRLHVSGDFVSNAHLKAVDKACGEWIAKGGDKPWAYTHNWRHLNPENAKHFSLMASVHSLEEADQAKAKGWKCFALAVPNFDGPKAFSVGEHKVVPCPNQTQEAKTCKDCKLCTTGKVNVAFAKH